MEMFDGLVRVQRGQTVTFDVDGEIYRFTVEEVVEHPFPGYIVVKDAKGKRHTVKTEIGGV